MLQSQSRHREEKPIAQAAAIMARPDISTSDRIQELSAINADVAAMLDSAGHAINALTNRSLQTSPDGDEDGQMTGIDQHESLAERKAAFVQHTQAYYNGLQAIVARMRRQAYALEEAGIIAAEAPVMGGSVQQRQAASSASPSRALPNGTSAQKAERITNGGLGNLDVGWLNSRGNRVGAQKESELIAEAKELLEEMLYHEDSAS